jgi:Ca-activated chloride channel family protein
MSSSVRITAAYAFAAALVFGACSIKNSRSLPEKEKAAQYAPAPEPKEDGAAMIVQPPVRLKSKKAPAPASANKSETRTALADVEAESPSAPPAPMPYSMHGVGAAMAKRAARPSGSASVPGATAMDRRGYGDLIIDEEGNGQPAAEFNTEEYARIYENPFLETANNPLSTFSIDVDGASYANARRFIQGNQLPPADAVRIEEFINYFGYDYPQPDGDAPFSITTEVAASPWNAKTKLVHIGLQGVKVEATKMPPTNLVFLIDVSGSMDEPSKLPLLKKSFGLLIDQLRPQDRISICVYAGNAGLVLPPTAGSDKAAIRDALDRLEAGGSTAGGEGILLAYKIAQKSFLRDGNNRIILATDGDFNVGVSSDGALIRLIEEKRKSGVFLSVLGFGMGNLKDSRMEQLADKGNGNYAYIDNIMEARKVMVEEIGSTLLTIAKDVKLQIEFNPAKVGSYRLIGYENRMLRSEDFNDDAKDAGELGAGHAVTALYEIAPPGVEMSVPKVDPLKYRKQVPAVKRNSWRAQEREGSDELLTVKFRYKDPNGTQSKLLSRVLRDRDASWENASDNFRFSAAAAGLGLLLRDSQYKGDLDYEKVVALAKSAKGRDSEGHRAEFIRLAETARLLSSGTRIGARNPEPMGE